jgi:flavin reductase (DIM6/NTAB) family NADH-FMN oxidoreductase RutF
VFVAVDAALFRDVLGQWPSGVTVVTTLADGTWHGMTASSFSSVSADPPLVSVSLLKKIYTHELFQNSGVFGVNILAKDQTEVGKRFAGMNPEITDRFEGLDVVTAETGVPLLTQSVAWLDCRIVHRYDGGDHTIFVGEVVAAEVTRQTGPLLYHSRNWGQFADQLPEQATIRDTGLAAAIAARGLSGDHVLSAAADAGLAIEDSTPVSVQPTDAASVAAAVAAVTAASTTERRARVTVLDAFSPNDHDAVLDAISATVAAGAAEVVLDDTAASATPLNIRDRLQDALIRARPATATLRLRDHAGIGMANALTALKTGARSFDATLGGVDGTLAAEDVLYLCELLLVGTDVERERVLDAAALLEQTWGEALPSRTRSVHGTA